jgi:hypothetical protein
VTCLDLNLDTGPSNTPYTAYQTTTYSAANTTETQTYTPGKTKLYEQQAYLFSELIGTSNVTTQGYIQDAMWALADSAFLSKLNTDSISGPDKTQAQDALNYYNAVIAMSQSSLESALNQSDYTILSEVPGSGPSGSAQNQEFIYDSPGGGPTAPEPASLSLMGGALMALGLLSRRLRQAKK